MKKLLFISILSLISIASFSQAKNKVKTDSVSSKADTTKPTTTVTAQEKIFVVAFPQSMLIRIIYGLRKSSYPSYDIDELVDYINKNAREYVVPTPTAGVNKSDSVGSKPAVKK